MTDNSATLKKLNLSKFNRKLIINKPEGFVLLDSAGFDDKPGTGNYELVLRFVFSLNEFEAAIMEAFKQGIIAKNGYLYLAYPKKGNKKYKEFIHRDDIISRFDLLEGDGFVLGTMLKFSKMVSLDETFTIIGLKKFEKKQKNKVTTSDCVADYVDKLPELRIELEKQENVLSIYDSLSEGYKRNWARYVYSAKTDTTKEKRLLEMADILLAGYKSKDLYLQALKK